AAGEGERGLKSLPNVRELIARSESPDLDPSAATAEERVKAIAPFVHGDMTVYIRSGTKHRESWGERQWLSADRTLAAAIRLGVDPSEMDTRDLFLETCQAPLLTDVEDNGVRRKLREDEVQD